jgi:dihydrofolate reductase
MDHGLGVNGERLHDWLRAGGVDPRSHRPVARPNATVFDEPTGAVIVGRRTFEFAGGWAGDRHDGVPIFVLTRAAPDEPAPGHARYVSDGIESCVAQAKAAAGGRDILLHGAATAQECERSGVHRVDVHPRRLRRPPYLRTGRPLAGRPPRRRTGPRPDPPRPGRPAAGQRPLRHRCARVRLAGPRGGRRRRRDGARGRAAQALLRAGQLDELELHVVPVLLGQGRRLFDNLPAEHIELNLVRRLTTPEVEAPAHVMHLRYRVRHP